MRAFTTVRRPVAEWCSGPRAYAQISEEQFKSPITIDLDTTSTAPCGARGWRVVEDWDGVLTDLAYVCEHVIIIGD